MGMVQNLLTNEEVNRPLRSKVVRHGGR